MSNTFEGPARVVAEGEHTAAAEAAGDGARVLSRFDLFAMAFQHFCALSLHLIVPVLVCRAAHGSGRMAQHMVALSLVVAGATTALQSLRRGKVGAGMLCPSNVATAAYISPTLHAASTGGLSLAAGMTLTGGLAEALLSRVLKRLNRLFTPDISALVVLLISLEVAAIGVRELLGIDEAGVTAWARGTGLLTLMTCVFLTVWGRGRLRTYATLIGLMSGFAVAAASGGLTPDGVQRVLDSDWVALPRPQNAGWDFSLDQLPVFVITGVACAIKAIGVIRMGQHLKTVEARKPHSVAGGVLADGCGTILGGLLGTVGVNPSPTSQAIARTTDVTDRRLGFWIGGIFLMFALLPKVAAVFSAMPDGVVGGVLVFVAAQMILQSIEMLMQMPVDTVTPFAIGIPLIFGLSHEVHPHFYDHVPVWLSPFTGSGVTIGVLLGLLVNPLLRIGQPPRGTGEDID